MGYIKNAEHFIRFINKILREEGPVDQEKLLPTKFYLTHIYARGDADSFTWDLRQQGPVLLEENRVLDWLSQRKPLIDNILDKQEFSQLFTQGFKNLLVDLETTPGIYNFCREDERPLYVGKSVKLGQRIASSIQRFVDYGRPLYVKYIVATSNNDISLLEAYFIAKLTPPYNKDGVFRDKLHYSITPIPEWSTKIKVYDIKYESE